MVGMDVVSDGWLQTFVQCAEILASKVKRCERPASQSVVTGSRPLRYSIGDLRYSRPRAGSSISAAILKGAEADESESPNDTKRRCARRPSLKKAKRYAPELSRTSRHIVGRVGTGGTSSPAVGSLGAHASAHAGLGQAAVHEIGRPRLLPPGRSSYGFGEGLRPHCLKLPKSFEYTAVGRR